MQTIILSMSLAFIPLAVFTILLKKGNSALNPKNFLPSVLRSVNEAVIIVNPNLKVEFANSRCEKLFKYTNQELINKKLCKLFENSQAYAEVIHEIEKSPQNQIINSKELNSITADNNRIPVTVSIKRVTDKSDKSLGFILLLTDTSETKNYLKTLEEKTVEIEQKNDSLQKLKQELKIEKASVEEKVKQRTNDFEEEHARLLASIKNLSLCFLMTDKYSNIILNNKAANNIFPSLNIERKITIAELQKTVRMSLDLNKQVEKSLLQKRVINISEVQIDFRFVNIFISPIVLGSNLTPDSIGVVIIMENQTAKHNLDKSKEDLFNIASHELRTPLTAIYGYASLVKQMYFGNIQNEELKSIINNIGILSKKLSLSVNNFLDSSKLEQGQIELSKDHCDLFTIVNESIKEMEGLALEKNLYIKFDPPDAPITVIGDKIRIMQILNILLSNAIKFTHGGGIYISIAAQMNFAKIIIQDTGEGISDENKMLLFRKFQRAGDNLLTRQEGTGLGLHISKLLTEKMGGAIQLERTELNKGSIFSFTIPVVNN